MKEIGATCLFDFLPVCDHQVPEPWTANVSFCGKDRRTLFITASKGLYSVRTRTKGAGPAK